MADVGFGAAVAVKGASLGAKALRGFAYRRTWRRWLARAAVKEVLAGKITSRQARNVRLCLRQSLRDQMIEDSLGNMRMHGEEETAKLLSPYLVDPLRAHLGDEWDAHVRDISRSLRRQYATKVLSHPEADWLRHQANIKSGSEVAAWVTPIRQVEGWRRLPFVDWISVGVHLCGPSAAVVVTAHQIDAIDAEGITGRSMIVHAVTGRTLSEALDEVPAWVLPDEKPSRKPLEGLRAGVFVIARDHAAAEGALLQYRDSRMTGRQAQALTDEDMSKMLRLAAAKQGAFELLGPTSKHSVAPRPDQAAGGDMGAHIDAIQAWGNDRVPTAHDHDGLLIAVSHLHIDEDRTYGLSKPEGPCLARALLASLMPFTQTAWYAALSALDGAQHQPPRRWDDPEIGSMSTGPRQPRRMAWIVAAWEELGHEMSSAETLKDWCRAIDENEADAAAKQEAAGVQWIKKLAGYGRRLRNNPDWIGRAIDEAGISERSAGYIRALFADDRIPDDHVMDAPMMLAPARDYVEPEWMKQACVGLEAVRRAELPWADDLAGTCAPILAGRMEHEHDSTRQLVNDHHKVLRIAAPKLWAADDSEPVDDGAFEPMWQWALLDELIGGPMYSYPAGVRSIIARLPEGSEHADYLRDTAGGSWAAARLQAEGLDQWGTDDPNRRDELAAEMSGDLAAVRKRRDSMHDTRDITE